MITAWVSQTDKAVKKQTKVHLVQRDAVSDHRSLEGMPENSLTQRKLTPEDPVGKRTSPLLFKISKGTERK